MNADEMTEPEVFELLKILSMAIGFGALVALAGVMVGQVALEQSVLESLGWAAGASGVAAVGVPCLIYTVACRYYRAELEAAECETA